MRELEIIDLQADFNGGSNPVEFVSTFLNKHAFPLNPYPGASSNSIIQFPSSDFPMGRGSRLSGAVACLLLLVSMLLAAPDPRYATIDEAIVRGDLSDVRAHVARDPEIATRPRERDLPLPR